MPLTEYRRKRDFTITQEPRGAAGKRQRQLQFVVHKHAASRLHYDLRLEWNGVLKSWAVPKGPSLDPAVRALAVEVEDHPIQYGEFEGIIPQGQYGAGGVIVWDRGEWKPLTPAARGLREGKLEFELSGQKLSGRWRLVRFAGQRGTKSHWLLIKSRDDAARPRAEFDVVAQMPNSVASGKSIGDLAPSRTKSSNRRSGRAVRRSASPPAVKAISAASLPHAVAARQPALISPQLAVLAANVPRGADWLHEIKLDGYRLIAYRTARGVRLLTRNGKDWTQRFEPIQAAVKALPISAGVLDGEVVALNDAGIPDFQALQNAIRKHAGARLQYVLFDLIHCDGYDLSAAPLLERKALLAQIMSGQPAPLQYSEHTIGNAEQLLAAACKKGLEGIISKRARGAYEFRRSGSWIKVKCTSGQEFVIGGFTQAGGARTGFGALLLGYHDASGALQYCGRVGTGFDAETLGDMHARLVKLEVSRPPFAQPPTGQEARGVQWVRPVLVAEVHYHAMTADGRLRQPVFKGLREDKPAATVTIERVRAASRPAPRAKPKPKLRSKPRPTPDNSVSDSTNLPEKVRLTHPDRVLYPLPQITKAALARYYAQVAEYMLPHVIERPLMFTRCPDGIGSACFYQKHPATKTPAGIRVVPIKEKDGVEPYCVVENATGLVSLAQSSVVEVHTWASRADALEQPDRLVLDLDPGPGIKWTVLVRAAFHARDALMDAGLTSFVKTTGGKGLHVVAPILPEHPFPVVYDFSRRLAMNLAAAFPKLFVVNMSRSKRTARIFIDYLRNGRGATCVAPYSPRKHPDATISMPLTWDQLRRVQSPADFTIGNALKVLQRRGDAWAEYKGMRQSIRVPVPARK